MFKGFHSIPLHGAAAISGGALPEFIVGPENGMVAQTVENLSKGTLGYDPILFCGASGTGKTSLALGIADSFGRNALSVTGADFARSFADAVDTNSVDDFRANYRAAELVVVDDLESMGRKQAAQLELTRIIDELQDSTRQMIVTCRQTPALMHTISSRLASRLHGGLLVQFCLPEAKTRRVLLQRLAESLDINISRDGLQLLASETRQAGLQTVPQLRHALLQLSSPNLSRIDRQAVSDFLSVRNQASVPSLRIIASAVSRYFRLKMTDLRGPTRQQHVVRARGIAMYLARQLTRKSLNDVGGYFGGRDHTTVLHACRKTETLLQSDIATQHAVEDLLQELDQPQEPSDNLVLEH